VEAIALVWRVGFRDAITGEFEELCRWLEIDASSTRTQLREIKERPGFAKDAGRYVYVTPEIVGKMAFQWAWVRWAQHAPETFLARMPASLLDAFLKRVERSAEPEVRRVVGSYFRDWLSTLAVQGLRDADTVKRISLLVESDLEVTLPILERLVSSAPFEELRCISGRAMNGWGPRRHLVWLMERLARLPQCFRAVEAILRRLAVAESEPELGNNSTAIYRQLFRIYLSGTAVAFSERVNILERILDTGSAAEKLLAIDALKSAMQEQAHRMGGPTFVAGRIPPDEWQPGTQMELRDAYSQVVALLIKASADALVDVAGSALSTLASDARRLLYRGFLPELKTAFAERADVFVHASQLLSQIKNYLRWDSNNESLTQGADYVENVRQWADDLLPTDLQGRLIRHFGAAVSIIDAHDDTDWKAGVELLANELVTNDGALAQQIDWLCSSSARGVAYLGLRMGGLDVQGEHLEQIADAAVRTRETALAQGYCAAYARHGVMQATRVSTRLDGVELREPNVAVDISMSVEPISNCISRTLRLVDAGRLPPAFLSSHRFGFGSEKLTVADAAGLLARLLHASASGDEVALRGSVQMLGSWVQPNGQRALLDDAAVRESAWQLLEVAASHEGAEPYHWGESVRYLASHDPKRAVRVCVAVLVADSLQLADLAQSELSFFAQEHGVVVVRELGKLMLDQKRNWRFQVGTLRGLVAGLPVKELKKWLSRAGVNGARALARHLMPPTVDQEGRAALHPLTEYVLTAFEDDDKTFHAFASGTRSMRAYQGDIAAQHRAEADAARHLLDHPLRRIREWAALEVESGDADAERWRQREEEWSTDF
jgi:hypothetical protein